jgi:hypothetical protein
MWREAAAAFEWAWPVDASSCSRRKGSMMTVDIEMYRGTTPAEATTAREARKASILTMTIAKWAARLFDS